MTAWAAALAALVTAGAVRHAEAATPAVCAPDSAVHRAAVTCLAAADREIHAHHLGSGAAFSSLLANECFRPQRDALPLDGLGGEVLERWWLSGGGEWLRAGLWARALDSRVVVFPPDVPAPFVPPAGPLGASVSCAGDTGCTFGYADLFLDRSVAEMAAALEGTAGPADRPEQTAKDCGETTRSADAQAWATAWWACVQHFRPRIPVAPVGSFSLPQAGLLRFEVERSSGVGHPKRCAALQTYDLATGAALAGTRCDDGPPAVAGSIDPRRVRELALLAVVGHQLALRRPLARVSLPRGLAPPPSWSFRADTSPPLLPMVRDGTALKMKVTWMEPHGADRTEIDYFADGQRQDVMIFHLDWLVRGMPDRIVRGCPSAELPVRNGPPGSLDRALSDARRAACSAPSKRR